MSDEATDAGASPLSKDPAFRAVVRDGRLWMSLWSNVHIGVDPLTNHSPWVGHDLCGVYDLVLIGEAEEEIIVIPCHRNAYTGNAEELLTTWASLLGYRRLWFGDSVASMVCDPALLGDFEVICEVCGFELRTDSPDLWRAFRADGCFPMNCVACGCHIPQFLPDRGPRADLPESVRNVS